jgi:hypothetical protein
MFKAIPNLIDVDTYTYLINLENLLIKHQKYIKKIRIIELLDIWNDYMIIYGPCEGNELFINSYFK